MKPFERYLAAYDDSTRYQMDRVCNFVQYVKSEFINENKSYFRGYFEGKQYISEHLIPFLVSHFKIPYLLGFESMFAPIVPSVWVNPIYIKTPQNRSVRIGESGYHSEKGGSFYHEGYVQTPEILARLQENLHLKNRLRINQIILKQYQKMANYIFPVLTVGGLFDRVWRAMGMQVFAKHYRQKTSFYRDMIEFYFQIAEMNLEGMIEAIQSLGTDCPLRVINILDDVAFKGRPMISPARWKDDFGSHYKSLNQRIKEAGFFSQIHTDGDVTDLIPVFQDAGFQGLQGWEGGCDPFYINDHFPNFTVVGFGDVNNVRPFGTPATSDNHVKTLMEALKENRHFIIGPSTVVFKGMPMQNVVQFIQSAKKYGFYK